jgi:predicted nucleic acid-binding Zn ribbon protein
MSFRRRAPRQIGSALDGMRATWQPDTTVAKVQSTWDALSAVWQDVVGEYVADRAKPARVTNGVLLVNCSESVVADTLTLESVDVLERLNERLGGDPITRLRCVTTGA